MGKKKEKEYYYKLKIKRDLIYSILFTIFAVILLVVVTNLISKNDEFIKNGIETTATIKNIKYKSEIDREKIESVEVAYVIDGEEYRSKLNQISSKMYKGKVVNIYYNPNNPEEIILNDQNSLYIFKVFIYIIISLGFIIIFFSLKKIIIYYTTIDGREVEAEIIGINEKNFFLEKSFRIQCKWIDEKGIEHIFNTSKYTEPYFIEEFNKMDIKKLKVRFKENNISKYVVITEKIDRKLSK